MYVVSASALHIALSDYGWKFPRYNTFIFSTQKNFKEKWPWYDITYVCTQLRIIFFLPENSFNFKLHTAKYWLCRVRICTEE